MIRNLVVASSVLALAAIATWVQGQDQPTPAEGESPNRYSGVTEGVAEEYDAPVYSSSLDDETTEPPVVRTVPESSLPSVLKRPQAPIVRSEGRDGGPAELEAPQARYSEYESPEFNEPELTRPQVGNSNNAYTESTPKPLRQSSGRPRPVPTAVTPKGARPIRPEVADSPERSQDKYAPELNRVEAPARLGTRQDPISSDLGSSGEHGNRTAARDLDVESSVNARPSQAYGQQVGSAGDNLSLVTQSPQLQLRTLGPKAISVGKPARYQLVLNNLGNSGADGIMIRAILPPSVETARLEPTAGIAEKDPDSPGAIRWDLEELSGRQSATLTLTVVPKEAEPFALNVDWALRPKSVATNIDVQQPDLKVTIDGPEDVLYDSQEIFTFRVTNPGTGPARDVRLVMATGSTTPKERRIGTIPPGEEYVLEARLVAREKGHLDVMASATSDDLKSDAKKRVIVRRAELKVEVAGPPVKFANTDGQYRVVVTNTGDAVAKDIVASVQLPVGCRLLGATDKASHKEGLVQWNVNELAPGQEATLRVACLFEASGDQRVAAKVESGLLNAQDSFATRVEAIADLKMIVHDPRGPRPVGEEVTYTIEVTNRGTKAAFDVKVGGYFSPGIEPLRYEGQDAEIVDGGVVFTPIRRIDPGKTVKLSVIAKASKAGNMIFKSTVECSDPETKLSAADSTRYFGSDLLGDGVRVGDDDYSLPR